MYYQGVVELKGKASCLKFRVQTSITTHARQTLSLVGTNTDCHPWICLSGPHFCWMDQGSVECKFCPTFMRMTIGLIKVFSRWSLGIFNVPTQRERGHKFM